MIDHLKELSSFPSWGNGRDIKTLSKSTAATAFESADPAAPTLTVTMADNFRALVSMLEGQSARCTGGTRMHNVIRKTASKPQSPLFELSPPTRSNTTILTSNSSKTAQLKPVVEQEKEGEELWYNEAGSSPQRDTGVSDETWKQLLGDIAADRHAYKIFTESFC